MQFVIDYIMYWKLRRRLVLLFIVTIVFSLLKYKITVF